MNITIPKLKNEDSFNMHIAWDLIDFNHWIPILSDYIIYPSITIILCLLSVFVVLGNSLVVSAIWHENQLHSVTNYLIASLAAADCLVGLVVMPFSIISEIIIGSWTFGPTWCDLWHSFDVLASTASIMNLCAISLDRYLAITNPISYPTKMTPKRVALLIVSLWTCSSLISFPAIAWWRAVGDGPLQQFAPSKAVTTTTTTTISETNNSTRMISPKLVEADEFSSYDADSNERMSQNQRSKSEEQPLLSQQQMLMTTATSTATPLYRCMFTDDTYYLLFSSIVSFYGPLCVMLYAYYRIYTAAVQQTRFLKYGSKQVMIGKNKRNKRSRYLSENSHQGLNEKYGLSETICDGISTTENSYDTRLVLRAHRGGGGGGTEINTRTSTNNTSFNAKHNGSLSRSFKAEQRRRDNLSNSDFVMHSSMDDDQRDARPMGSVHGRIVAGGPSSSGDFSQSSGERQQPSFDSTNQVVALSRQSRIEQINSKRDRIRIGSQRFDSNKVHENSVSNYTTTMEGNAVHQIAKVNLRPGDGNETNSNERSILERKPETLVKSDINNPIRQPDDLYIESNHSEPLSNQTKNRTNKMSCPVTTSSSIATNIVTETRIDQFLRNPSRGGRDRLGHHRIVDRDNQRHQLRLVEEDETSEDFYDDSGSGSGSSSGSNDSSSSGGKISNEGQDVGAAGCISISVSSGSYGTGSIASVLVRPQQCAKDHNLGITADGGGPAGADVLVQVTKSMACDIDDSHSSNSKLRRTLSVGDAGGGEPGAKCDVDIESGPEVDNKCQQHNGMKSHGQQHHYKKQYTPPNVIMNGRDQLNRVELISDNLNKARHRASCGNAIGGEFKPTTRTLDIRSWVRLGRNKQASKCDNVDRNHRRHYHQHDKGFVKPPPSLVPLMMMNSDTSTDSSITTTETRQIGGHLKEDGAKNHAINQENQQQQVSTKNRAGRHYSDVGHANPSQAFGYYINKKLTGKRTSESVRASARLDYENHLSRSGDSFEVKELEGAQNKANSSNDNSNKVQMLYYDSDKLIQSIIDLTDIHYIDCTNQPAQNASNASTTSATVLHKDTGGRGEVINISTKMEKFNDSCDAIDSTTMAAEYELDEVGELEKLGGGDADAMNGQAQVSSDGHTKRIKLELDRSSVPRQQRSVGKKLTKLAKERKAAKTLGIVVGVFILCWLPFFVVNIVVALCGMGCIYNPQILLSIVTWLGWLNSAMNPVIYACWSRDFRRAFKRVLCTWVEFLWPYDGASLARKLGLKRSSNYSNAHSGQLNRTANSSIKWTTSTTTKPALAPAPATTTTTTTSSTGTGAAAANRAEGASIYETTTRANGGHRNLLLASET